MELYINTKDYGLNVRLLMGPNVSHVFQKINAQHATRVILQSIKILFLPPNLNVQIVEILQKIALNVQVHLLAPNAKVVTSQQMASVPCVETLIIVLVVLVSTVKHVKKDFIQRTTNANFVVMSLTIVTSARALLNAHNVMIQDQK